MDYLEFNPKELARAGRTIERFVNRFDQPDGYRILACHAALPLLLTPDLLNFLHNRFVGKHVPWIADADLLLSELCYPVGYELYAMEPPVREFLIDFMRHQEGLGPKRMQEVARYLINYVNLLYRTTPFLTNSELKSQQWAAMVYLDGYREKVAEEAVRSWKQAVERNDRFELVRVTAMILKLQQELKSFPELVQYARDIDKMLAEKLEEVEVTPQATSSQIEIAGISLYPLTRVAELVRDEPKPSAQDLKKPNEDKLISDTVNDSEEVQSELHKKIEISIESGDVVEDILDMTGKLDNQATSYFTQGRYLDAASLFLESLEKKRVALPPGHPAIAHSLNDLAGVYYAQGQYIEAEKLLEEALEIYRQNFPDSHLDIATTLNQLAGLNQTQGRYEKAELLYKEALEMKRRSVPVNDHLIAHSLRDLAGLYRVQGRYDEAELLFKEALELYQQGVPLSYSDIATAHSDLGSLDQEQGRYSEAEELFLKALEIRRKALPEDNPTIAHSLNDLAGVYRAQGRYAQAVVLLQEALEIYKRALPDHHPDLATMLNQLGLVYQEQGKYSEAENLLEKSLEIRQKVFPPTHPSIASSLNNLGNLYHLQGKTEKAIPLLEQAIEIFEQRFGQEYLGSAHSYNNLALLYRAQERYSEAEMLFQRALSTYEKNLGPDHPNTADGLNNLAELYRDQGRNDEAEPLLMRALEIRKQQLGLDHPSTAQSLHNLAGLRQIQQKIPEAESLYRQALEIREKTLGRYHPDIANSLNNLAGLYDSQGKLEKAKPLYEKAFSWLSDALGINHPSLQLVGQNINSIRQRLRQKELEELLTAQYEKSTFFEKELGITADPARKFELKKRIEEIKLIIGTYEEELSKIELRIIETVEEEQKNNGTLFLDIGLSTFKRRHPELNGEGIRVAVLSNGIDILHPFLKVVDSVSTCGEDIGIPGSLATHGAGVIASRDKNHRGIAPNVNLINIKVLQGNGQGRHTDIVRGVEEALDRDAQIILIDLGFNHLPSWSDSGHGWFCLDGTCDLCKAVDNAVADGAFVVVPAGNIHDKAENLRKTGAGDSFNTELCCPGQARGAFTVGALTKTEKLVPASFSSRGPTSYGLSKPDISTIGVNITSTIPAPHDSKGDIIQDTPRSQLFGRVSGSSPSAAIVAGAAALALQLWLKSHSTWTPADLRLLFLTKAVSPLPKLSPLAVGAGYLDLSKL